ncbi:MAG: pantetheine-phosphate adenylyltransferase [Bacteroidia bacterium]|nr:pantetheine-phosphate adenylyltransferase [Bacteroidia bacterium]MDW8347864.1 pantetheine-phosphate adenylyltransferase [Bacteroidia bacterium]
MRTVLFVGSFDPFTLGHHDIVMRGLQVFDKVVIGLGVNPDKKMMFDLEKRLFFIQKVYENDTRIRVTTYSGLTIQFAAEIGACAILRGIRNSIDLEYEKTIALANKNQNSNIETIFLLSMPEYSFISSTVVREMIKYKGNLQGLVPDVLIPLLQQ